MKAAKCLFIVLFIMLIALFSNVNTYALRVQLHEEPLNNRKAYHSEAVNYQAFSGSIQNPMQKSWGNNRFEVHIRDTRPRRTSFFISLPRNTKSHIFLAVLSAAVIVLIILLKKKDLQLYGYEMEENPGGSRLLQFSAILFLLLFFWGTIMTINLIEELGDLGVGKQIGVSLFIKELKTRFALNPGLSMMAILMCSGYILTLIMGVMGIVRWNLSSKYKGLHMLSLLFLGIMIVYNGFLIYYHDFFENLLPNMLILIPVMLYMMGVMANKNHHYHYLRVEAQKKGRTRTSAAAVYGDSRYGNTRSESKSEASAYGVPEHVVPKYVPDQYVSKLQDEEVYTSQEDYIKSNVVSMTSLQSEDEMPLSSFEFNRAVFDNTMYGYGSSPVQKTFPSEREIPMDRAISNDSTVLNDSLIERDPSVFVPNELSGFGFSGLGYDDTRIDDIKKDDDVSYHDFKPSNSWEEFVKEGGSNHQSV